MIEYIVIADVILSWLTLLWVRVRPRFIAHILDPIYSFVKKTIPTQIGPFELTPIIVLLFLVFIRGLILIAFPDLQVELNTLLQR